MGISLEKTPLNPRIKKSYASFLSERGLRDENDADCIALYYDDDYDLVATGARSGRLIKQIAVSEKAEGTGAAASIISELVNQASSEGITHLMLCTKPANKKMFMSMGFYPLSETRDALLMENKPDGLDKFLSALPHPEGNIGAVVCNCNPFTLGHRFLIESAAKQCDALHVFVLSEDGALFSPKERIDLVRAGTADLKNVYVHESSVYLVSRATFPAYFIKETERVENVRTDLDLKLFCERIAPALGIKTRFVGTEPFCPVTNSYNKRMKELLPDYGINCIEIPRHKDISASRVRALIKEGKLEETKLLVPETTYELIQRRFG